MKIDRSLSVLEAQQLGAALPWALVRSLSQVTLGPVPVAIDADELLEARFFSADEEIRLFRSEGQLLAVHLTAEPNDNTIVQVHRIENKAFGSSLTVSCTLQPDEDGQMNITYTRLTGWEGAE